MFKMFTHYETQARNLNIPTLFSSFAEKERSPYLYQLLTPDLQIDLLLYEKRSICVVYI